MFFLVALIRRRSNSAHTVACDAASIIDVEPKCKVKRFVAGIAIFLGSLLRGEFPLFALAGRREEVKMSARRGHYPGNARRPRL